MEPTDLRGEEKDRLKIDFIDLSTNFNENFLSLTFTP